ncbi:MAG: hypothetical protein ACLR08_07540 [Dorea longicatena]
MIHGATLGYGNADVKGGNCCIYDTDAVSADEYVIGNLVRKVLEEDEMTGRRMHVSLQHLIVII